MLSPTITEINNLIMTANYISPIDTLPLIFSKTWFIHSNTQS